MSDVKYSVLYVTEKNITVAEVDEKGKVNILDEKGWSNESLNDVLKTLKAKLSGDVKVVLSEALGAISEVKISSELTDKEKEKEIKNQIKVLSGEALADSHFDFVEAQTVDEEMKQKQITFFYPNMEIWKVLKQGLEESGIKVASVEIEQYTMRNNVRLIDGLKAGSSVTPEQAPQEAAKVDAGVETVATQSVPSETPAEASVGQDAEIEVVSDGWFKRFRLWIVLVLGLILLLGLGGGAYWYFFMRNGAKTEPAKVDAPNDKVVTKAPSPTPTTEPTPTPEEEVVDMSSFKLQVLNGSGVSGEAGRVKDFLTESGFVDFTLGNADSYGYAITEVKLKPDLSGQVWKAIESALNGEYVVVKSDTDLEAESKYDAVIVVGERK